MRYAILGPIELCDAERRVAVGGPRQVALLALLLLNANRVISSDRLIDALWGDLGPEGALKRLQVAVVRLRRVLDAGAADEDGSVLRTVSGGYLLVVRPGEVDAELFQARVDEGRRALDEADAGRARDLLRDALALWRGAALAEVAYEEFALTEIRRLEELRLAALEARIDAELRLGAHSGLIGELESLVAEHRGRERFAAQLMLALYRCGRQGDALDVYAGTREHLAEELGLEPGRTLKALQRDILQQAETLDLGRLTSGEHALSEREAGGPFPLPPALTTGTRETFVARAADLERLAALYDEVAAGARRIVLLSGEPGIGKTRLATEFALRAHDAGAIVLYGRCDEEALLVLQPFVEALRHYICACPTRRLARQVQRGSGELRRVVPELADRIADLPEPLGGDPEGARSRLFEAVSALLCAAAQDTPVVFVLDDLHWADRATLLLLRHLVRHPREARLMVLATYRETELDDDHPLCATLAELGRDGHAERIALAGLDEPAVSQLVSAHAGEAASAELRQIVYEGTEGNAFFVVEVLRHLAEAGAIGACDEPRRLAAGGLEVPDGVKGVVRQRIARLGPDAGRLLATAAVVGRSFDFDVLARLSELGEDDLVDVLEAAVRARVIEEVAGVAGGHIFSHALIRDTLYEGLTATRRALLHRRVGFVLEQTHEGRLEPYFAELASHFAQAGSSGDLHKAVEYGARAGERALSQLAYEHAAEQFRRAVALLDAGAFEDQPRRRCDLAIAQGEAERRAGNPAYRATLLSAARLALQLRDPDRLAHAALANNRGYASSAEGVDRDRVAMLRVALDAYDVADSPTRAALLSLLALELSMDEDWRLRDRLSDEALAMARRVGHPNTLARVLTQRGVACWRPQSVAELQRDLLEAERLADRLDDPLIIGHAAYLGAHAAMETGDLEEADRLLGRLSAVAEQLGQPFMRWYDAVARTKRRTISGPAEDAERLAVAAADVGHGTSQPDIALWFLGQLLVARFLQGTLDRGDPCLPDLFGFPGAALPISAEVIPSRSMPLLVGAATSALMSEVGRLEEARASLDLLMSELDDPPMDYTALAIPAFASVACARLADMHSARRLQELLEPHGHRLVNTGSSWFGAAAHHLGVLAVTLDRLDEADARFAQAERTYRELGAEPWLARLRSDRAAALAG